MVLAGFVLAFNGAEVPETSTAGFRMTSPRSAPPKAVVFRALFDEYFPRVRRYVSSLLDNVEEVDEITAEVFVVAWRKLHPAKPMGWTWFLRVAGNKVRDADRRARSKSRAFAAVTRHAEYDAAHPDPADSLAVREALRMLNARERQVVVLTYWEGLTAAEVAEVLRASTASVWTTLTRARRKLRVQLDEEGRGE